MENKASVMGFLLITTLISSTYPSLATENDDKPLIDPDTSLDEAFARSPGSEEYNINAFNSIPAPEANYFMKNCAKTRDVKCDDEFSSRLYQLRRFTSVAKILLLRTEKILNRCSAETSTPLSG
ncbi:hypothetical protein YC2023_020374 [Brassica napus]